MTYDDAGWHSDSVDDLGLDESAAGIHIAAFLAWAARKGLVNEDEHADAVSDAEDEVGTPSAFIDTYFDSQIDPSMLTRRGNRFAEQRYSEYLDRLEKLPFVTEYESLYQVPDTWDTCAVFGDLLDEIFAEWEADYPAEE